MAEEIERKFLVRSDAWRALVQRSAYYQQGYLTVNENCTVRVRLEGERALLNIKNTTLDIRRQEYEYAIPLADAREILDTLCAGRRLSKTRHFVAHDGEVWEVDEFDGANRGLVLAELELTDVDQAFDRPDWLGAEVSGDARYTNAALATRPYSSW
ncbi:MAG: CYTH domain-containing protein [Gammaproteobacteria bacterium]|nr:CYTH domain-containing protein [Gammaproteobacteria bacterium]